MAATFNSPTPLLVLRTSITDAATAPYDFTLTRALTILDASINKNAVNAAAANTVQLQTVGGAANITNAINGNVNATILVRAGVVDDLSSTIASAGILRYAVTRAGGDAGYDVNVYCIPA